jgi:hypothetical protein
MKRKSDVFQGVHRGHSEAEKCKNRNDQDKIEHGMPPIGDGLTIPPVPVKERDGLLVRI